MYHFKGPHHAPGMNAGISEDPPKTIKILIARSGYDVPHVRRRADQSALLARRLQQEPPLPRAVFAALHIALTQAVMTACESWQAAGKGDVSHGNIA